MVTVTSNTQFRLTPDESGASGGSGSNEGLRRTSSSERTSVRSASVNASRHATPLKSTLQTAPTSEEQQQGIGIRR